MTPNESETPRPSSAWALCLVVAGVTFFAHAPAMLADDATFVYDDTRFVLRNEHVHELHAPWTYLRPATAGESGAEGIWRPARTFLFAVEWFVFGDAVRGWRFVGVTLHALAAALAALVLFRLVGDRFAAGIGALFFALHPLTAEVSSWVSSQGDALALVGFLAAIAFHLRGWLVPTLIAAAFSLLGKEMAVTLPLVLLVLDLARGSRREGRPRVIGTAVLVAVYVGARFVALSGAFGQPGLGPAAWTMTRAMGLFRDATATLFPISLGFDLQFRWTGSWADWRQAAGGFLALAGLAYGAYALARRGRPLIAAGLAWALVGLGPTIVPFFPLKIASADRFLAFSLVGLGLAVAALVVRTGPRVRLATCLVLLVLGVLGGRRTLVYANDENLWHDALSADATNVRAREGLAAIAYGRKNWVQAERRYAEYVSLVPENPKARYYLGMSKLQLAARGGEGYAEGHRELRQAVELWNGGESIGRSLKASACIRLARSFFVLSEFSVSSAYAREVLESDPPATVDERAQAERILADLILHHLEQSAMPEATRIARGWLQSSRASRLSVDELTTRLVGRRAETRAPVPVERIRSLGKELAR